MTTLTPGKPTPNPKYKPGQAAKAHYGGGNIGASTPQAGTPTGNIGGDLPSGGYAAAGVSRIVDQNGRVIYSNTYKGGEGTTPGGVTVKTTPTPPEAQAERERLLRENAANLREAQARELKQNIASENERQAFIKNRDYRREQIEKALEQGEFKSLDYVNGQYIINTEEQKSAEVLYPGGVMVEETGFYAPKITSPQETQPVYNFDFSNLESVGNPTGTTYLIDKDTKKKPAWFASVEGQTGAVDKFTNTITTEVKKNIINAPVPLGFVEAPAAFLTVVGVEVAGGVVKGAIGLRAFAWEAITTPANPKNPLEKPLKLGGEIVEGSINFAQEAAVNTFTLNWQGLAGQFGEAEAYGRTFEALGIKGPVGFAKDIKAEGARLKFEEATYSEKAPIPPGGAGGAPLYTVEGRAGVFVPRDYNALALKPQSPFSETITIETKDIAYTREVPSDYLTRAPELQTQLIPKKFDYLTMSMTGPGHIPKPMTLWEFATKYPDMAKELAKENGQTVFNPEGEPLRVRDLTTEERLAISKKQAGLGLEWQKTLGGNPPPYNAEKVLMFYEGEPIAIKEKGGSWTLLDNKKGSAPGPGLIQEPGETIFNRYTYDPGERFKPDIDITGGTSPGIKDGLNIAPAFGPHTVIAPGGAYRLSSSPGFSMPIDYTVNNKTPLDLGDQPINKTFTFTGAKSRSQAGQAQDQRIEPIHEEPAFYDITNKPSGDIRPRERKPEQKTRPRSPFKKQEENAPLDFGGYTIEVRRRGRFETIAKAPSIFAAFNIGLDRVRKTAAASFKIEDESGDAVDYAGFLPGDIFQSNREPGVFIQKRNRRISSPGEKVEITLKGNQKMRLGGGKKWGF